MRIFKIITVIRSMQNKNFRNFLIVMCSSFSSVWFLYFIQHPKYYTIYSALEAILTLITLTGVGIYSIYKDNIDHMPKLCLIYSLILIIVGSIDMSMDLSFIGASNFSNFILISSIFCELLYIVAGSYILIYSI